MATMEKQLPDKFCFYLKQDECGTGNFEITHYDNKELNGEGTLVYSKQATGVFPMKDQATWDKYMLDLYKVMK